MQPDIDQLLSTIQSFVTSEMGWQLRFPGHEDGGELEPFVWNSHQQGELTPLNLVRSQGWLHALEPTAVLDCWLTLERVGAVNGKTWLVPDGDAAGILLDASTQAARAQLYQMLRERLQTELQNLQGWQLSCDADYALTLLIGEAEHDWIALAPIVPHATRIDENAPIQMTVLSPEPQFRAEPTPLESEIQAILDRLGTIQLYGYYGGGYNQVHDYRLQWATGATLDQTLDQVMRETGLLEIGSLTALQPTDRDSPDPAFKPLARFLHSLVEQRVYRFSFWNSEHFYIFGQPDGGSANEQAQTAPAADTWAGVVLHSHFSYNP